ncbi:MAG: hypothetical protein C4538_09540 [Nitrospiraceae bacterium]|nr:MAG: hypothetical protein C4538_09540 [Nitrospiraceae bacterium]
MKNNIISIKSITVLFTALLFFMPGLQGCSKESKPPKPAKQGKTIQEKTQTGKQQVQTEDTAIQETAPAEGYVYKQGDRRDPFVPLIVPTKKIDTKGIVRLGTLESYDISEFALLAIAQKGEKPYALLLTPDNRSFTASKGTIIGLNKGRVEEITESKVVLVEYAKDFRGDMRPRKITLELSKER